MLTGHGDQGAEGPQEGCGVRDLGVRKLAHVQRKQVGWGWSDEAKESRGEQREIREDFTRWARAFTDFPHGRRLLWFGVDSTEQPQTAAAESEKPCRL